MKKKHAYKLGLSTGRNIASDIIADNDPYDDLDSFVDDCLEAETNCRFFSPFEFTAKEFNDSKYPDEIWEKYESGVYDGVVEVYNETNHIV